jgi:hypothetical protein
LVPFLSVENAVTKFATFFPLPCIVRGYISTDDHPTSRSQTKTLAVSR